MRSKVQLPSGLQFPVWMMTGVVLSVVSQDLRWVAAQALVALGALTWQASTQWSRRWTLGWANAVTWVRIVATAALAGQYFCGLKQVLLAFLIFAFDGVDGAIARRLGTTSTFGALLDKECDAFFILTLGLVLWSSQVVGPWILIPGLWRYGYGGLLALRPALRPVPRSQWARYSFSAASLSLMAAMIPGNPAAMVFAAFATFAISASFVRSLFYSFARS